MSNEVCGHGDPEYGQFKFNCPICNEIKSKIAVDFESILEQENQRLKELLKEACKEIQASVEYDVSWIEDQGNILIEECEPEYQRYKGHCNFLNKDEVKEILSE